MARLSKECLDYAKARFVDIQSQYVKEKRSFADLFTSEISEESRQRQILIGKLDEKLEEALQTSINLVQSYIEAYKKCGVILERSDSEEILQEIRGIIAHRKKNLSFDLTIAKQSEGWTLPRGFTDALREKYSKKLDAILGNRQVSVRLNREVAEMALPKTQTDSFSAKPTIGVVTALPKEYAAVCVMLEEPQELTVPGDSSEYTIGKIPARGGGHNVVVVTLLKQMGNNSAALAATNLLRSFPTVEDVLMVGIAGGIPQKGLRLGDVAVSNEKGVIQYDNLKRSEGHVEIRDTSGKPSARMIGKTKALESKRIRGERPWEQFTVRGEKIENGIRPPHATDAQADQTVEQKFPKIHYGLIGSANTLLKDADFRDSLAEQGVIAVEMEGSGIADGTWDFGKGYLLIRGICDYADDKKNDVWQEYAAVAAGAYMRALIEMIDAPPEEKSTDKKPPHEPEPPVKVTIPEDRSTLILFLPKIGEARFEVLLGILKVPTEYLSGKSAGLAIRAADLVQWAEGAGGCGLEGIRKGLTKIYQSNPPKP